mmetsp:Transcript_44064/g.79792  ORF Transcript_44064/g.79792 Transcript_44064/m.79792 type:complete len:305 (+) Transcript_44064:129-1043(+)
MEDFWRCSDHNLQCFCRRWCAVRAALEAVELVVLLWCREVARSCPGAGILLHEEGSTLDLKEAVLAPVLAPGVAHDPVETLLGVGAPAHHGDAVVRLSADGGDDATCVVQEGHCIDIAGNGPSAEDLLHHGIPALDGSIFRNGCIGVAGEANASFAKGATGSLDILCRASEICLLAEAAADVRGASEVRLACGIGETTSSLVTDVLDPLIRGIRLTTVAGASVAAIHQMLHRKLDVHTLRATGNLDTVRKCRDTSLCPARAAVLRNVLIHRNGEVALAILVAPGEAGWEATLRGAESLMGGGSR